MWVTTILWTPKWAFMGRVAGLWVPKNDSYFSTNWVTVSYLVTCLWVWRNAITFLQFLVSRNLIISHVHSTRRKTLTWSRDSAVSIVTKLLVGRSGARIPAEAKDFSILIIFQSGSGAHPTSYSVDTEVLSRDLGGWSVRLTARRMSRSVHLFSNYILMAWAGTIN
jgi:hypothetical protein